MAEDIPCESQYWDRFERFAYFTSSEIELLTESIKFLKIETSEEFGIKVFDNLFCLSPELKINF